MGLGVGIFLNYILNVKDNASKSFKSAGASTRNYSEELGSASKESHNFSRTHDSTVQPSLATSTSRTNLFTGAINSLSNGIKSMGKQLPSVGSAIDSLITKTKTLSHDFSNFDDSISAVAQHTGMSRREVVEYRAAMIAVSNDLRKSGIAVTTDAWKNALMGLTAEGLRNIPIMKDIATESLTLAKALRLDPEQTARTLANYHLQLGLTRDEIKDLTGVFTILRKDGFDIIGKGLDVIDPKFKAFVQRFPNTIKDVMAMRGVLDKYGLSQSLLNDIMDASLGDMSAYIDKLKSAGIALSDIDMNNLELALSQGNLDEAMRLSLKTVPELIKHLDKAGPAAQILAGMFGTSVEGLRAIAGVLPEVQNDTAKAIDHLSDKTTRMTAAQNQAIEVSKDWHSRLASLGSYIKDQFILQLDKVAIAIGDLIPPDASDEVGKFISSIGNEFTNFITEYGPKIKEFWEKDISPSAIGTFDRIKSIFTGVINFIKDNKPIFDNIFTKGLDVLKSVNKIAINLFDNILVPLWHNVLKPISIMLLFVVDAVFTVIKSILGWLDKLVQVAADFDWSNLFPKFDAAESYGLLEKKTGGLLSSISGFIKGESPEETYKAHQRAIAPLSYGTAIVPQKPMELITMQESENAGLMHTSVDPDWFKKIVSTGFDGVEKLLQVHVSKNEHVLPINVGAAESDKLDKSIDRLTESVVKQKTVVQSEPIVNVSNKLSLDPITDKLTITNSLLQEFLNFIRSNKSLPNDMNALRQGR